MSDLHARSARPRRAAVRRRAGLQPRAGARARAAHARSARSTPTRCSTSRRRGASRRCRWPSRGAAAGPADAGVDYVIDAEAGAAARRRSEWSRRFEHRFAPSRDARPGSPTAAWHAALQLVSRAGVVERSRADRVPLRGRDPGRGARRHGVRARRCARRSRRRASSTRPAPTATSRWRCTWSGEGDRAEADEQPFQVVRREDGVTLVLDVPRTPRPRRAATRRWCAPARLATRTARAGGRQRQRRSTSARSPRSARSSRPCAQTLAEPSASRPAARSRCACSHERRKPTQRGSSASRARAPQPALLRRGRPPRSPTRSTTRLLRELQALEAAAPGAAHAGFAHAARGRRAAARQFAEVRHAVPMLSLRQRLRRRTRGARPSTRASQASWALRPRIPGRVRRGAQVRRPGDQPALRAAACSCRAPRAATATPART